MDGEATGIREYRRFKSVSGGISIEADSLSSGSAGNKVKSEKVKPTALSGEWVVDDPRHDAERQ
jgi:hypothetical protein